MRHPRLKWFLSVAHLVLALATSAAAQGGRPVTSPLSQPKEDPVTRIKKLKVHMDELLAQLPPQVRAQLVRELAQTSGTPSGPQATQLPPGQERLRGRILDLKGQMDQRIAKLPPQARDQLMRELASGSPSGPQGLKLPAEQERVRRAIQEMKVQMDERLGRLPPEVRAQVIRELASGPTPGPSGTRLPPEQDTGNQNRRKAERSSQATWGRVWCK